MIDILLYQHHHVLLQAGIHIIMLYSRQIIMSSDSCANIIMSYDAGVDCFAWQAQNFDSLGDTCVTPGGRVLDTSQIFILGNRLPDNAPQIFHVGRAPPR